LALFIRLAIVVEGTAQVSRSFHEGVLPAPRALPPPQGAIAYSSPAKLIGKLMALTQRIAESKGYAAGASLLNEQKHLKQENSPESGGIAIE